MKTLTLVSTLVAFGCSPRSELVDSDAGSTPRTDASQDDSSNADAAMEDCSKPILDPEVIVAGTPTWKLAELLVYAAPVGDLGNSNPFNASVQSVLAPNHTFDSTFDMFKSTVVHAPPFDGELAAGIARTSFENSRCFRLADLAGANGIVFSLNLVPSANAPTGVTFEQPNGGPMIQFSTLDSDADLFVDDELVDPNFDSQFLKAGAVYGTGGGKGAVEGYGHMLLNYAENQALSPAPLKAGKYRLEIHLRAAANTCTGGPDCVPETLDVVHFEVKP